MTTANLFTNRATAKIAADVASNDTAITLVPGGGALFPAPGANQRFRLVLQKGTAATDQREYMICTGVAGDVLTVTRAQEGTPAANFTVGDEASLVITATSASEFTQQLAGTLQGVLKVEADPTVPLGIATKQFVESGRLLDAPSDGKDYARQNAAWHALGAAAGLAVPIPISAGGTGGTTLPQAQTNLVIGVTTIDDLAPATPKYGDRWIKPSNMTEMVWVPNAGGGGAGVWINPADAASEAYPLAISKGGTGATDAPTALTNLGGTTVGKAVFTAVDTTAGQNALGATTVGKGVFTAATQLAGRQALGIVESTTSPWLLSDGTVAAPGLAWNSEPGLGFYRLSASRIGIAAQGAQIFDFLRVSATMTQLAVGVPSGPGISQILLSNASFGSANSNTLGISVQADGSTGIAGGKSGTATDKGLLLTFPAGVSVAGPLTATGILAVRPASGYAILDLNSPASGVGNVIEGLTNGSLRWQIILGDSVAQSGSNAGADFSIARFSDTGVYLGNAMGANRSTGNVAFPSQVNIGNGLVISAGGMGVTGGANFYTGGTNVIAGASLARDGFNYTATSGVFAFYSTGFQPNGGYQMVGGSNFASVGDTSYSQAILQPGVYSELRFSIGGSGNNFAFWNDASAHKSGGSASWIIPSDERLKENIQPYTKGLADLIQLNPVTYTRKPLPTAKANAIPYNHNEIGLTAQQAQVPFPEMVSVDPSFGSDGMLMLDVGPLTFAFINAFKQINQRLNQLEHA